MKTSTVLSVVCAVSALCAAYVCAGAGEESTIAFGTRFHAENSAFTDLPFDNGDMTYSAAFEWHERDAYWQICVGYSPKPGRTNDVEYVLTPEVNLLMTDRYWRGGLGAVWSYVEREKAPRTTATGWTSTGSSCSASACPSGECTLT